MNQIGMSGRGRARGRMSAMAGASALVGIAILVGTGRSAVQARDAVTFSEDVAPIVFAKCASCHRPGEAAPFSLLTYDDVKRRGTLIAQAVTSRAMPPWKAVKSDYPYKGDRRLTDPEIDVLQRWVAAKMPEGDPAKMPAAPAFTPGWQLGPPDLVVSMSEPFEVPAYGSDIYRNFVVPLNLTEDKWVRAVDFRPSARSVVHHSLFFLDGTGTARAADARDPKPGFAGEMGGFSGARGQLLRMLSGGNLGGRTSAPADMSDESRAVGTLGGWALGANARALPDGLAFFVPKGADLVLSTHFHPSGKVEKEASTVGLYFADAPPTQAFAGLALPPLFGVFEGIDIPAGEKEYTIRDSFVLPVDVKAFNTGAHAHYLAKRMKLTATLPDGATKTLLQIDDWDFAWQDQYPFEEFVFLPKGTRLDGSITYDNSADNPRNPSSPPKRVTWGEQSTDEMGSVGLLVVAAKDEDLPALQQGYAAHVRQAAMTRPGLRRLMMQRQAPRP
jgi:mono/diheme cytochrome c family protein